jgi:hypothetical protein
VAASRSVSQEGGYERVKAQGRAVAYKDILLRIADPPCSEAWAAAQPMSSMRRYVPLLSHDACLCLHGTSPDIGSVSDRSRLFIQAGRIDIGVSPYLTALCLEHLAVCIPKLSICIIGSVLCLAQPLVWAATAVRFSAGLSSGLVLIPSGLLVRPIASTQSRIAGQQQASRAPSQTVWSGSHLHHGKHPLHGLNDRSGKMGRSRKKCCGA